MASHTSKGKNTENSDSGEENNVSKVDNDFRCREDRNSNVLTAESTILSKTDSSTAVTGFSVPEKDYSLINSRNLPPSNLNLSQTSVCENVAELSKCLTVDVEEYHNIQMHFETGENDATRMFSIPDNFDTSTPFSKLKGSTNEKHNLASDQLKELSKPPSSGKYTENLSENLSIETEKGLSVSGDGSLISHGTAEVSESSELSRSYRNTITHRTIETCHNTNTMALLNTKKSVETQTSENMSQFETLCSKHAIPVIAEGKSPSVMPDNPDLCTGCSKSMLSYIVLIQQFLDGLAKDICRQIDPLTQCFECVKESLNITAAANKVCDKHVYNTEMYRDSRVSDTNQKSGEKLRKRSLNSRKTSRTKLSDSSRTTSTSAEINNPQHLPESDMSRNSRTFLMYNQQHHEEKTNYISHKVFDPSRNVGDHSNLVQGIGDGDGIHEFNARQKQNNRYSESTINNKIVHQDSGFAQGNQQIGGDESKLPSHNSEEYSQYQSNFFHTTNDTKGELQISSSDNSVCLQLNTMNNEHQHVSEENFKEFTSPQFLYHEGTDGILSTLHKVERGLQNISKSPSVWEQIAEIQQNQVHRNFDEAFVTIARNNSEVLGTLVLGASLLLCGTSRTLCVLVHDSVNTDFMSPLSSMFHEVLHIRSLDSAGTTKLNLLDQPELGISFAKLNVWRLLQFTKCVYLNPDTMVIQNCDELFYHEELSAVPDIGWPDCFNSGVFVFRPRMQTFWELLDAAEQQGNYDGGEQGLLNTYFDTWHHDIHKKLSFIYNLMANVSYTYTPAFKQFGRNVKVVQFLGALKPWHVKFFNKSGQIAHTASVHPTYVQFVHVWLNIYRVNVLPLLSPEIQSFAMSQNIVSASEILRFFPSPIESEADFLLAPPSVRILPHEQSIQAIAASLSAIDKLQLPITSNKSFDVLPTYDLDTEVGITVPQEEIPEKTTQKLEESIGDDKDIAEDHPKAKEALKPKSLIPGSEVGDYQGMTAWEQGRMDYEGAAKSDTIIQRLSYLMRKQDRLV